MPQLDQSRNAVVRGRQDSNKKGLKSLVIGSKTARLEYLYARDNFISQVSVCPTPTLKILDLGGNLLTDLSFLESLTGLRQLYLNSNRLSSVESLPELENLEHLSLSQNYITSFEGMRPQPRLKLLSMAGTPLQSFYDMPIFPELQFVRMTDTPLEARLGPLYRAILTTMFPSGLRKIDYDDVTDADRANAALLPCQMFSLCRFGYMPSAEACQQGPDAVSAEMAVFETDLATGGSSEPPLTIDGVSESGQVIEGTRLRSSRGPVQWERWSPDHNVQIISEHLASYHVGREDIQSLLVARHMESGAIVVLPPAVEHDPEILDARLIADSHGQRGAVDADLVEGGEVYCAYEYIGGDEGESLFTWTAVCDGEEDIDLGVTEEPRLTVPNEAIGRFICLHITPMRQSDGAVGKEFVIQTEEQVVPAYPCVQYLNIQPLIAGEQADICVQGAVLRVEAEYFGGHEGKSLISWYCGEPSADTEIVDARGATELELGLNEVGNAITVVYTPVSDTQLMGEPVSFTTEPVCPAAPTISSMRFSCSHGVSQVTEAIPVRIEYVYHGGYEGSTRFAWMREVYDETRGKAVFVPIEGATSPEYMPCVDDVGRRLRMRVTPVRDDGMEGKSVAATTVKPVFPSPPTCLELTFLDGIDITEEQPACAEAGEAVRASAVYVGGVEGDSIVRWYRAPSSAFAEGESPADKDDAFTDIPGTYGCWEYVPTSDDVGCYLRVVYTPVSSTGEQGEPASTTTALPVAAQAKLKPSFTNSEHVTCDLSRPVIGQTLRFNGEYFAESGIPAGQCTYQWQAIDENDYEAGDIHEGTIYDLEGFTSAEVEITPDLVGLRLRCVACPVDANGLAGDMYVTEWSLPIVTQQRYEEIVQEEERIRAIEAEELAEQEALEARRAEEARRAAEEIPALEPEEQFEEEMAPRTVEAASTEAVAEVSPEEACAIAAAEEQEQDEEEEQLVTYPQLETIIAESGIDFVAVSVAPKSVTVGAVVTGTEAFKSTEDGADAEPTEVIAEAIQRQWLRDEEEIEGAIEATYTVVAEDVGHVLTLRSTLGEQQFTDSTETVTPPPPVLEKVKDRTKAQLPDGRLAVSWTHDPAITAVRATVWIKYNDQELYSRLPPDAVSDDEIGEGWRRLPMSLVPEADVKEGSWRMPLVSATEGSQLRYRLVPIRMDGENEITGEPFEGSVDEIQISSALSREFDTWWGSGQMSENLDESGKYKKIAVTTKEVKLVGDGDKVLVKIPHKAVGPITMTFAEPLKFTIAGPKGKTYTLEAKAISDPYIAIYAVREFIERGKSGSSKATMCRTK